MRVRYVHVFGIPPRRWPALLLVGAFALSVARTAPLTARRIAREWGERYAPPGSGEEHGSLLDHYRLLEALAPLVGPQDRILVVTDRWPEFADLAYWFGPRATLRIRLDPEFLLRYLRGGGLDPPREFAVEGARRAIESAGLAFEEGEFAALLERADVAVALDTSLDLRSRATGFETLLDWSPRKLALRRPRGPR